LRRVVCEASYVNGPTVQIGVLSLFRVCLYHSFTNDSLYLKRLLAYACKVDRVRKKSVALGFAAALQSRELRRVPCYDLINKLM